MTIRMSEHGPPVVDGLKKGAPAAECGMMLGDTIIGLNGEPLTSDQYAALPSLLPTGEGASFVLTIERGQHSD